MINLYYDVISECGPVPNGASRYEISKGNYPFVSGSKLPLINAVTMFYDVMIAQGCRVNLFTNEGFTDNLFYPIEVIHPAAEVNELISNATLDHMIDGKFKVLILFQEEGADGWAFDSVRTFARKLCAAGVHDSNIVVVLGDLNNTYNEYFAPFKTFGIDWWQPKHQSTCQTRYLNKPCRSPRPYDHPLSPEGIAREFYDIDIWGTPNKTYLSFNGHKRIHRAGLVSELLVRELQDVGYISWGAHPGGFSYSCDDGRVVDHTKPATYVEKKMAAMQRLVTEQLVIDGEGHGFFDADDRKYNSQNFYDSAFSVITETFAPFKHNEYPNDEFNVLWTTEKTWKPIAIGHPFMVLGSVGTMQYLKQEGYHTFNELFDESYDLEPDLIKRINMIVDNIERISKMPKDALYNTLAAIKPKLHENRQLFYQKNHANKFYKLFQELQNG